jgi:hypothetical protein
MAVRLDFADRDAISFGAAIASFLNLWLFPAIIMNSLLTNNENDGQKLDRGKKRRFCDVCRRKKRAFFSQVFFAAALTHLLQILP